MCFGFLDPDLRRIEVERQAEAEMTRASERRMVHIGVIEAHDVPANARSSGPGGAVRVAPVILNSRPERERVDWAELCAHVEPVIQVGGDDGVVNGRIGCAYAHRARIRDDRSLPL